MKTNSEHELGDANADPLTGESGAHPVATGIGAAAAGAAGLAVAAAVAGPVGVVVAAVGGALIGGYAGKAAGEMLDPTDEDNYWREEHGRQPFADAEYDEYAPAYRTGYEGYVRHGGARSFEEAEGELQAAYEGQAPKVPWSKARAASHAAWQRAHARHSPAPSATGEHEDFKRSVISETLQTGTLGNAQMPR